MWSLIQQAWERAVRGPVQVQDGPLERVAAPVALDLVEIREGAQDPQAVLTAACPPAMLQDVVEVVCDNALGIRVVDVFSGHGAGDERVWGPWKIAPFLVSGCVQFGWARY